jgi:hypothetical protein
MTDGADVMTDEGGADPEGEMPPGPLQLCRLCGFEYPVFISWPHKIQSRGSEIVAALATALENRFQDEGGAPVLLDAQRNKPGFRWDAKLRKGICRSVVTIAFLVRTYFESEYCRVEWAISETLEKSRLASDADQSVIIPVVLSKNVPLPREVKAIQYYMNEFQELLASGKDVTTHEKWPVLVEAIVERVFEIIALVCQTERNWSDEEQIAQHMTPKRFTWPPPPTELRHHVSAGSMFPRLAVEKSVA